MVLVVLVVLDEVVVDLLGVRVVDAVRRLATVVDGAGVELVVEAVVLDVLVDVSWLDGIGRGLLSDVHPAAANSAASPAAVSVVVRPRGHPRSNFMTRQGRTRVPINREGSLGRSFWSLRTMGVIAVGGRRP